MKKGWKKVFYRTQFPDNSFHSFPNPFQVVNCRKSIPFSTRFRHRFAHMKHTHISPEILSSERSAKRNWPERETVHPKFDPHGNLLLFQSPCRQIPFLACLLILTYPFPVFWIDDNMVGHFQSLFQRIKKTLDDCWFSKNIIHHPFLKQPK